MDKNEFFAQSKRCFFPDGAACVAYASTYCKKDVKKTIALAERIVRREFVFTLRWDMEKTNEPIVFPDAIDWLAQPGDDQEFVYAFNRMRFWITLGQAYLLTGDEKYANSFTLQLKSWVSTVKREDPSCAKAWRTIEAGIRMEYWMKAIRYFQNSPALTDRFLDLFTDSMHEHMRYIMGIWNSYNLLSNWGVLANHGLFVASVLLPQDPFTKECTKEALERLDQELRMQVYDDGVQWEQSAMYHNEVLHDYLDVIILARTLRIPLPHGFADKVHSMATAAAIWQKPDGTEPMSGDSDRIDQRDLMEKAAIVFYDPFIRSKGEEHVSFDALWDIGARNAKRYETMRPKKRGDSLSVLSDSGQVYYQKEGTYIRFKAGTLGAGHGHADQLHLDLFADGEDVLVDSGRYTYVPKPDRYEFKNSSAHNVITVDGKNSYSCKDSWEYSKMSKAYGLRWKEKDGICLFQAGHLGYYQDGVFVSRTVIVLTPKLLVIADRLYGDRPHTMEARFHFNPKGTVKTKGTTFSYTGEKTDVWFTPCNAFETTVGKSRYSDRYNSAVQNDCATVFRQCQKFGSLITVVSIGKPVAVQKIPVTSTFKHITFPDSQIEGVSVDGWTVVISHYEWGSPTDSFQANGHVGWGQCVVFRSADKDIGTVLEY